MARYQSAPASAAYTPPSLHRLPLSLIHPLYSSISSALHPSASSPLASERWMNMVDVEPCGAASTLRTSRPWKTVASSAEASFA